MRPILLSQHFVNLASYGSHRPQRERRGIYLWLFTAALLAIWLPITGLLLFSAPSFTSSWTLVLPGSGSGYAVQLENLGQASSPSISPYANNVVDPRVNYKAIILSQPVLAAAAAQAGMRVDEFGEPRIKLIDQSALMHFNISGENPTQARDKASALHQALAAELNRLRIDELGRRESTSASAISGFSKKLADSQRNIIAFQSNALISSLDQYREVTLSIERSRTAREQLLAKRNGLLARAQGLETSLKLPTAGAPTVLALQNDAVFQQLLERHAAAEAEFNDYASRWGERHFKVVAARQNSTALYEALLQRAAQRSHATLPAAQLVALANSGLTRVFMEELVTLRGELEGINAELDTLQQQINAHKARIDAGAADAIALEDLRRKQQVATAVFTTALATLDLGKTDIFSSYPMLQTLLAPTLPEKSDRTTFILAMLGGALATLLCLLGTILLWIRKPYLQKIFRNA